LTCNAKEFLAEKGYDPAYGARPLKRAIQQYIENPLAMEILSGIIKNEETIVADIKNGGLVFKTSKKQKKC
jgi:ATP-dependent Clp protease ATP-binding subunit ClpA